MIAFRHQNKSVSRVALPKLLTQKTVFCCLLISCAPDGSPYLTPILACQGCPASYRPGLLLIVRFAYNRRFVGLVFVVLVLVINIVIIVVGVSRRHRIDHDGDGAPVDQPSGRVLGDARSHVGSCWMS